MWERSESRSARGARSACWGLSWAAAGVVGIAATACAHGIDPADRVLGDGSNGIAGSSGAGGTVETTGTAGDTTTGMSGSGGTGGDAIDMTGGSAGTSADDGSTGDPNDASLIDASDAGSAVVDTGPPCPSGGKALSFDGTSRVDIPGTSLPIGSSARTVEMWISPATVVAPAWSPDHTIFENGTGDLKAFALDMDVPPMMEVYVNPAANSFFFNTGIAQATWFHVASTYDGATTTHAFINGVDKGAKTLTGVLASTVATLTVGGTGANHDFIGSIDEVRVWNVARTAAQIQQNMSVRLSGNEAGLVGYWRFDDGVGTTAHDSSTKNVTGTLVGPVKWIASGVTLTCP